MTLNVSGSLFKPTQDFFATYDFSSIVTGNSYLTLYAGFLKPSDKVYESFTTTPDSSGTEIATNDNWSAQTFTVGNTGTDEAFYFTKIHYMNDEHQTGNTLKASIQEITAGKPNGTKLIEWSTGIPARIIAQDGTNYTRVLELRTADNIRQHQLKSGTQYAIVWEDQGVSGTQIRKNSSGTYAGGAYYESTDAGANWTESSGHDAYFKVFGSTTNSYTLLSKTFTTLKATTVIDPNTTSTAAFTEAGTLDFSTKVNFSGILKGLAIIEGTFSDDADEVEYDLELLVTRNGIETTIGTVKTELNQTTISAVINIEDFNLKRGDDLTLRILVNHFVDDTTGEFTINHDPKGTSLTVALPFKTEF